MISHQGALLPASFFVDLPNVFPTSFLSFRSTIYFLMTLKLIHANWIIWKYRTLEGKKLSVPLPLSVLFSPKLCLLMVMLTLTTALPSSHIVSTQCMLIDFRCHRSDIEFLKSRNLLGQSHFCVYV